MLDTYKVFTRKEISVSDDLDELQRYSITDERRYGIFLHDVLSHVIRRGDLPAAMHRAAYRARLTPKEEEEQLQLMEKALADPSVADWFDGAVRVVTERPASTDSGVRRPDRIVWLPSGSVCVVDYKFGHEVDEKYFHQVRRYMGILRAMGYDRVEGYLWYPLQGKVLAVEEGQQYLEL